MAESTTNCENPSSSSYTYEMVGLSPQARRERFGYDENYVASHGGRTGRTGRFRRASYLVSLSILLAFGLRLYAGVQTPVITSTVTVKAPVQRRLSELPSFGRINLRRCDGTSFSVPTNTNWVYALTIRRESGSKYRPLCFSDFTEHSWMG